MKYLIVALFMLTMPAALLVLSYKVAYALCEHLLEKHRDD